MKESTVTDDIVSTNSGGGSEGFVDKLFTDWSSGNLDTNIAKYLFWIIIMLLIFSALNFAKIPNNLALQWLIAIPVSFLVTAYIAPDEIFAVLTAYTALGLTLSVVVPFVIMMLFSSMLLSVEKIKGMSVGKIMIEVVLWLFFVGFLIYKLVAGYTGIDRSNGVLIVIWVVLGLSVLILIFNKVFRRWVRKLGLEIKEAKAESQRFERSQEREAGRESE